MSPCKIPTNKIYSLSLYIAAFLLLSACDTGTSTLTTQTPDNKGIPIPAVIATVLPSNGALSAYLRVDVDEDRKLMTIIGDNASINLTGLTIGRHTFTIEFEFTFIDFPNTPLKLASSSKVMDIVAGSNTLDFSDKPYETEKYDYDNDKVSNLTELAKNTNPFAGIAVSLISSDTGETGTTGTFTVVLTSAPTAAVSINLSSSDTTEGTINPTQNTLTFSINTWYQPQTVTVTGVDDNIVDGDMAYSIITAATNSFDANYDGLDPDDVSVTNRDNDIASFAISAISGNTTEDGISATFTVALSSAPTDNVIVAIHSSNTGEGMVDNNPLTFTPSTWNQLQTVTVTGVNDSVADGNITYQIVLDSVTSNDPLFDGQNPPDVTVVNIDNDSSGFNVSPISGNTTEAGGTATFTVQLNTQPTAAVTIGFSSSDETEGTVNPPSITLDQTNWNSNQNIMTVTGVDDTLVDGDQNYSIVVGPASSSDANYDGKQPSPNLVPVKNINNDFAVTGVASPSNAGTVFVAGSTTQSSIIVAFNATTQFTVTAASGYATSGISECGVVKAGYVSSPYTYTTGPIKADCQVLATFVPTFSVSGIATPSTGGSVIPTLTKVASGDSTTVTVTANPGYRIIDVTGDAGCNNSASSGGVVSPYTYTTGVITTADCHVTATFSYYLFKSLANLMNTVRNLHTATLLPDGTVLITGGHVGSTTLNSAELYDPKSQIFTALNATLTLPRQGHTATLLPDGTVLITGGSSTNANNGGLNSAELYDPVAKTFTGLGLTKTLTVLRYRHTATLLPNGKVLIAGGSIAGAFTNSAELYDPVAKTFTALSTSMTTARGAHTATLLPDGRVLLTGGYDANNFTLDTTEVYDPVKNTFTAIALTLPVPEVFHTATLLPNGQVLISGVNLNTYGLVIYDPISQTISDLGIGMNTPRESHTATLLPDGTVLMLGGTSYSSNYDSGELFTALPPGMTFPANSFNALAGRMSVTRNYHATSLLSNGKVLITGGATSSANPSDSAVLYDPNTNTYSTLAATMTIPKKDHSSVRLGNGKVLITGGSPAQNTLGIGFSSAELYDPDTQTFTALSATMTIARYGHTSTLLPDGTVLITGGYRQGQLNSAELYDPVANTFIALTAVIDGGISLSAHAATLLPNGKVLITGGYDGFGWQNHAQLYDPVAQSFTNIGTTAAPITMTLGRSGHSSTLLPNGMVLIAGGYNGAATPRYTNTAEVYDYINNNFTPISAVMTIATNGRTAALLPNGQVYLVGGTNTVGSGYLNSAEVYTQ